jgi:hypothetical protein
MTCVGPLATTGLARDAGPEGRRVQAAIMLDGLAEAFLGEVRCHVGESCVVIAQSEPKVTVTIDLRRYAERESVHITIECPQDCSFASWRRNINSLGKRKFDIFSGVNMHVETLLVLRPRNKIGELFLIVE